MPDLKKLAEVKRWIVFENTNAEDTKGAIRLGTEVVQASDYDALLQEAAKWEQDALQKLNDYKCAMIDLKAALQEVETLREHIYCLENPLARHEEAAPQEGKMHKYTPARVTGGWTVHRDEKPMLILSSPLTEAEANAFCDLLNAEFGAIQSVDPSTNNRCGACQRGDHADCSGWCFCDHSAPQDEETKP